MFVGFLNWRQTVCLLFLLWSVFQLRADCSLELTDFNTIPSRIQMWGTSWWLVVAQIGFIFLSSPKQIYLISQSSKLSETILNNMLVVSCMDIVRKKAFSTSLDCLFPLKLLCLLPSRLTTLRIYLLSHIWHLLFTIQPENAHNILLVYCLISTHFKKIKYSWCSKFNFSNVVFDCTIQSIICVIMWSLLRCFMITSLQPLPRPSAGGAKLGPIWNFANLWRPNLFN